jgi:hypothetical protein
MKVRVKTVKEMKWAELTKIQQAAAEAKHTPTKQDKETELFGVSESGSITWMTAKQFVSGAFS